MVQQIIDQSWQAEARSEETRQFIKDIKRHFDKEGYQRYWNRHYNQGACRATLITSQVVKS